MIRLNLFLYFRKKKQIYMNKYNIFHQINNTVLLQVLGC